MRSKNILICVLNWGLGHATRCMPLIDALIKNDHNVYIGGSGISLELLKKEYPDKVKFLELPDYNVQYSNKGSFFLKMLIQIPKIINNIKSEQQFILEFQNEYHFNLIISDNRYGCYHPEVRSYFLTHQLYIKISKPAKFLEKWLAKVNFRLIDRFSKCYIIDEPNSLLSGELSNFSERKLKPGIPILYAGVLSRMEKREAETNESDILIILSGPEPQRSLFEEKIVNEAKNLDEKQKVILVRGTNNITKVLFPGNFKVIDLAGKEKINELLNSHQKIVCRSGYSSIMDLYKLQKKALLVPTPDQTEQEYLAKHLAENFGFKTIIQDEFSFNSLI